MTAPFALTSARSTHTTSKFTATLRDAFIAQPVDALSVRTRARFFETLRTPRLILLDAVTMMVERNSLRAISRIKHCKVDAVLYWVGLAGQQGAAVNRHFIRNLPLTQVQIDDLWSFVKKNRSTCNRRILPIGVMPGFGVRLPCPITCVPSRICRTNAAKKRQKLFWRPSNRAQTGDHPCSPVTSSRLTLRHSSPPTAHA